MAYFIFKVAAWSSRSASLFSLLANNNTGLLREKQKQNIPIHTIRYGF